jgi:tetratricopeptide (TPR) repeat protein
MFNEDNDCTNDDLLNRTDNSDKYGRRSKSTTPTMLLREEANIRKEIRQIFLDYDWEEKYEWIHQKILKGDRIYNRNKFKDAIYSYVEALIAIEFARTTENKHRIIEELEIPCIMNLIVCLIEKRELDKASKFCERGISLNKQYYRAYYLRGKIYQEIKDYEKAKEDYSTALKLCKEEPFEQEISDGLEKIKAIEKHKVMQDYKIRRNGGYMPTETDDINEKDNDIENSQRVLKYNDDLEELNKFGLLKYIAYPVKITLKYLKFKTTCCKRRKGGDYVAQNDEAQA